MAALLLATSPATEIEEAGVVGHIRELPEARSVMGDGAHQAGLARAEAAIEAKLEGWGYEPVSEPLPWRGEGANGAAGEWRNIYVDIPGETAPDEIVLVGAHFDAVADSPGADDNASGVAGALAIANALGDEPMARTVRIVFFNLEEVGLVGSFEHARRAAARMENGGERIVAMVNLEMIGYFTDEPDSQRSPLPKIPGVFDPPTVGDFIAIVANSASSDLARTIDAAMNDRVPGLKTLVADFIPGEGWMVPDTRRSDHARFWDIGVPAVMITDTSNFRTPHYHRESDTLETLDTERMTKVVQGVAEAVWRLAGPPDRERDGAE